MNYTAVIRTGLESKVDGRYRAHHIKRKRKEMDHRTSCMDEWVSERGMIGGRVLERAESRTRTVQKELPLEPEEEY